MKEKKEIYKVRSTFGEFQIEVPPDRNSTNIAYQNSINQNDIEKFEFLGSHKNGKVDEKANKFVLPFKRKVKKWKNI